MVENKKVLLDLVADMEDNGKPVSFLGAKVSNPADLAKVAEIVRSPRYETFHYLFTKDGEVKGTSAVSCRLAGSTMTVGGYNSDYFFSELIRRAREIKADTFYFLHNHPSGDPAPSKSDIVFTKDISKELTKKAKLNFGGHVIINSSRYAVIDSEGKYEILPISYDNAYKVEDMRKADSFFNTIIRQPEDFAACAKLMQKSDNSFYMVGMSARNLCNCLYQVSYDILNEPPENLIENIREWSYTSGVHRYALLNFSENKIEDYRKNIFFKQLGKSGYIIDILTEDGTSLRQNGNFPVTRFIKKRAVHQVHEYNSQYESYTVQLSPFRAWLSKQNLIDLSDSSKLDYKEEEMLFAFREEKLQALPLTVLWKLSEVIEWDEVIILNDEVDQEIANPELLSARQRAADAVERIRGEAIQKSFESTQVNTDSVSNEIIKEANCLSKTLHGQYSEGMTWNHDKAAFVDEAYVPALQEKYTNAADPDYIKSLVRKYTSRIDKAQNEIPVTVSPKIKI